MMDTDSDDDVVLLTYYFLQREKCRRRQRRYWIHRTIQSHSELGEYNKLIQELRLDAPPPFSFLSSPFSPPLIFPSSHPLRS